MSEEEKNEEQKKTGEQNQLEEIAQQQQLVGKKSNYFSNVAGIATNVCAIAQGVYQKVNDVKCGIEAKLKLAAEIKQAEKYTVSDLKNEEFRAVHKSRKIEELVKDAEKKVNEYTRALVAKEKDYARMHEEFAPKQQYSKMSALRDKLHQRELEMQITKSIISHYQTLLARVKNE